MHSHTSYKRLERSQHDHLIGGVCSGIANSFNIDPNWVRLAFLVSFCFFLITPLAYCLLWIFIPKSTDIKLTSRTLAPPNTDTTQEEATEVTLLEHTPTPPDNITPALDGEFIPHEHTHTSHLPDLEELLASVEVTPIVPVQPSATPIKNTDNTSHYLDKFDSLDGMDDFPEDFLASFDDDTPASIQASSSESNTTPMSNDFPEDFLTTMNDDTPASTQVSSRDDSNDLMNEFMQSIQEDN